MAPILTIIINWDGLDLTRRCIQSLMTQTGAVNDILIVDNGSDTNPESLLTKEFPAIELIRNSTNLGVAGGRNVGLKYALKQGYKFVLFIDNDAYAAPDMLSYLSDAASRCPAAGIFGPKILRDDKPNVIWRAGCTSWKLTYLHSITEIIQHLTKLFGKFPPRFMDPARGVNQPDYGQFDQERNTDFQIGCAQFIRTEVFEKIGILDEEFKPYGSEDIDFCARATRANWRIRYVPQAVCYHRVGSSFRDEYDRTFHNAKNLLLLARKNLSKIYFGLCFLPDFICLTIPLMLIKCYFKRQPLRRKAFLDALIWHVRDIARRGIMIRNHY